MYDQPSSARRGDEQQKLRPTSCYNDSRSQ
jgi:hypothetical protein